MINQMKLKIIHFIFSNFIILTNLSFPSIKSLKYVCWFVSLNPHFSITLPVAKLSVKNVPQIVSYFFTSKQYLIIIFKASVHIPLFQ